MQEKDVSGFSLCCGKYYFGFNAGKQIQQSLRYATNDIKIISPYLSPNLMDILCDKAKTGVNVQVLSHWAGTISPDTTADYKQYSSKNQQNCIESFKKCIKQNHIFECVKTQGVQEKTREIEQDIPENHALKEYQLRRRWLLLFFPIIGLFIALGIIFLPTAFITPDIIEHMLGSTAPLLFKIGAGISVFAISLFICMDSFHRYTQGANKLPLTRKVIEAYSEPITNECHRLRYSYHFKNNLQIKFAKNILQKEHKKDFSYPSSELHAKLFIIDDTVAYTGSVNYTNNGIYNNYELCVTVKNKNEIRELTDAFNCIYNDLGSYDTSELCKIAFDEHSTDTIQKEKASFQSVDVDSFDSSLLS
ncbi:MAG: phospholipase D-like domain-containing protein [Christensenella sp.]